LDLLVFSSLIFAALGLLFLVRYIYLNNKVKEEKSFLVVGIGVLLFWFFGGAGLVVIALIILCLAIFRFLFA
jgi:hypothetical protein